MRQWGVSMLAFSANDRLSALEIRDQGNQEAVS